MIEGTFREQPADAHVSLRADLLERERPLRRPEYTATSGVRHTDGLLDATSRAALHHDGLLVLDLDEPLSNDAFIALGEQLGTLIPETDPAVEGRVDDGVVLNVVTTEEASADTAIQPFASNALTLHSEGSGRDAAAQPRFVVLMCCDPGEDGAVMSTVLVPMDAVARRLDSHTQAILRALRYRHGTPPPILRTIDGRPVFSFRDFRADPLDWRFTGDLTAADSVSAAVRSLLASMYDPTTAAALTWRRGLMVVIDNRRFFHGRCAARGVGTVHRRHLKRLRIR